MNSFHVSIKNPCSENWNSMTPNHEGRFCGKCSKTVVDFTGKSQDEIKNYFLQHSGTKICGRMNNTQIDSQVLVRLNFLSEYKYSNPYHAFYLSLLLIFGTTLFSCNNHKDEKINTIEVDGIQFDSKQYTPTSNTEPLRRELIKQIPPRIYKSVSEIQNPNKADTVDLPQVDIVGEGTKLISTMGGAISCFYVTDCFCSTHDTDSSSIIQDSEEFPGNFENHFDIFPNPADDYVNVKIVLPGESNVRVDLFDMNGRLIRTILPDTPVEGEIDQQVEIGELPPATYLMRLIKGDQIETKRLVVI